ncbi:helix-turn-helix transcriptional regulator [Rhizorhapis suberifaciens]|uniref:LuxR family transcriptional regulator/LuxR family quorum-sensing system transcriptional regulator CciR n=1 Tax=Rhizorhapis suberifaciens TaxID=13656 RepID=A0A840HR06_9SPHN|nr:LuxR family transcriptional regulator [Rhizorhapis suberifaciens]MBB4640141.1 LuxR family transcriptional regulator/LuxR family quorum-sensing system transcriptional regulator CciR [Rhizorhapis suberifaciens]
MRHFLAAAAAATDVGRLWDVFVNYFDRHGIRQITCVLFSPPGLDHSQSWVRLVGMPEMAVTRYFDEKVFYDDPIRLHAMTATQPFKWLDIPRLRTLSPKEEAFLENVFSYSPAGGVAIPVFGPNGRNGYVAIGFPEELRDIPQDLLTEFQVIAQFAHQRFCEFAAHQVTSGAALSRREKEVLHWVARGKSNGVIADIIGISANTVDTHLRRIYMKLQVSDRVSAALAGIGHGYISLD